MYISRNLLIWGEVCIFQFQRKLDNEMDLRRRAEEKLKDTESMLHNEIQLRSQMSTSSHQSNEKISQLEKLRNELSEKLKTESDTTAKYKKSYTDLQQVGG